MLSVFRDYPDGKVVYIAPMKALVSERISDWKVRIEGRLGKKVVELTGDVAPDAGAIQVRHSFPTFYSFLIFLASSGLYLFNTHYYVCSLFTTSFTIHTHFIYTVGAQIPNIRIPNPFEYQTFSCSVLGWFGF